VRRAVLLMKDSAFQVYCANRLYESGFIDTVIVEEGDSFIRQHAAASAALSMLRHGRRMVWERQIRLAHIRKALLSSTMYGRREYHNLRILGSARPELRRGLEVRKVASVNERMPVDLNGARAVFVFGTGLVKPHVYESTSSPFFNLHWGWSPTYRGEGIVSALASEGVGALGVTVHRLSPKIDGGAIVQRARPKVDSEDNFYSIGLKLTVLGTSLFEEVGALLFAGEPIDEVSQDLSEGRLYSGSYMRSHPELYVEARRALRRYQTSL